MEQSLGGTRRVAFFGGSFDPPHDGHLAVARAAQEALGLDVVLFGPVGAQPLKPQGSTASFEDRLAMTRLAISGQPGFALSLIDAPKADAAPNYTVDTLLQLRAELPSDGMLFCLMGADSFLGLRRWYRAEEIPFVAQLIVAARPGQPLDDLRAALPRGLDLDGATGMDEKGHNWPGGNSGVSSYILRNSAGDTTAFHVLPGLHVEISASKIREDVRELLSGAASAPSGSTSVRSELVPATVLDYIRAHGLYR